MNVVAENHADSLRCLRDRSGEGLIAAVIGDALRDTLDHDNDALPESLLALLCRLDAAAPQRAAAN